MWTMIPWSCDALKPTAERYASLKFRRMANALHFDRVDYVDGCELSAFLALAPPVYAKHMFHWTVFGLISARKVVDVLGNDPNVLRMVEENRAALGVDDGLAMLNAMLDGGWKAGGAPPAVRMMLLHLRKKGYSQPEIAEMLGLSLDRVRYLAMGRPTRGRVRVGASGHFAAG